MTEDTRSELQKAIERLAASRDEGFRQFMSEQWPTTTNIREMVHQVEGHPLHLSERKLRLFAVACCRRVFGLLPNAATRNLVETCELHADGLATAEEMYEAMDRACPSVFFRRKTPRTLAREAARSAVGVVEFSFASLQSTLAVCAASYTAEAVGLARPGDEEQERQAQADLLRDVVGDPLVPAGIDPAWLQWNGGLILRLASAAYDDRLLPSGHFDPDRLAILADGLLDAGCPPDAGIVQHLRTTGPHVRGCFALDLLTGRS
jgi:hypothetical protein